MAWGTKYQINFTDYEGLSWVVTIRWDGYGGDITTLTAGETPLKLSYHGMDKHQPIVGSTLEIQVVYESAADDLFVEDDQVVNVLMVASGVIEWEGYLTPFQHFRRMGGAPHYATFLATDQLGLLKELKFEDSNGDPYYYIDDEATFLQALLDNTALNFENNEGINIYDSEFSDGVSDSPIKQTFWYPERYWNETNDERANCYDVLSDILEKYGARICQSDRAWWIQRPQALWSDHTTRLFSSSWGVPSYNTEYRKWNMQAQGAVWLDRPEFTKLKRVGRCEVQVDPDNKSNMIKNSTFDDFTHPSSLLYWTTTGVVTHFDGYLDMRYTTGSASDNIVCTNNTFFCHVRFVLDYKATWTSASDAVLVFQFTAGGLYLNSSEVWQAAATKFEYDVYTAEGGTSMANYKTLSVDLGYISRWDLTAAIYEMEIDSGSGTFLVRGARLETTFDSAVPNVWVYAFDNVGTVLNTVKKEVRWGDANITAPTVYLSDSDCHYYLQKSTTLRDYINERYIIGDKDTVGTPESLQELLARQIVQANYTAQDMIRGTVRGYYDYTKALTDDDLVDSYGYKKCFIGQEVTWDIRRVEWSGTWLEVGPVYNDETTAWASETYDTAAITGPSIEITTLTVSGTDTATSNAYTAVLGEMIRIVATVTDKGTTDLPNYDFDGQTGTLALGINYLEFRCGTAGSKTFVINHTDGERANCFVVYAMYSLKGI